MGEFGARSKRSAPMAQGKRTADPDAAESTDKMILQTANSGLDAWEELQHCDTLSSDDFRSAASTPEERPSFLEEFLAGLAIRVDGTKKWTMRIDTCGFESIP